MMSFQDSSFTDSDGEDRVPLDDVAFGSQSKYLDDVEDEVSSPIPSLSEYEVSSPIPSLSEYEVSSPIPSLSSSPTVSGDYFVYDATTKFKPIPYKEDNHKIENLINLGYEKFDHYKLFGLSSGEAPLRVGPVLQVFSVTIFNGSDSPWDFEIFGEISITDGQSNTFYIYKCEEDKPEFVSTESNRLILEGCPITPSGEKVKFSLKDKGGGNFIEGNCDVDFPIDDAYPRKKFMKCLGKDGFYALMEYTQIPFAFVADVLICIKDKNQDRVGVFDIYGTIKVNNLVLFDKPASDPAYMHHGKKNPFVHFPDVLAVPIHSPLAFEIKLYSGGDEFAHNFFEIVPYALHPVMLRRDCNDESHYLFVDVKWALYEDYFEDLRWKNNAYVKWNRPPPTSLQLKNLDPPSDEKSKRALVEVFSVFLGGKSKDPFDLCGKIVIQDIDGDNTVFIFARNSKIPDELTDGQWRTVSLAWPARWFVEKDFFMFLNLKDKHGSMVCKGHLHWRPQWDTRERQYGRRLCDVILGLNGYFAAVHYSVFKNGKKAKVTVTWEGDDDTVVYGVVYASYCNREYPSTYDNEYYRSIIFRRSLKDGGETVKKDGKIPLSKSCVSAPWDCTGLHVDFNLSYHQYNQFGVEDFRRRRYSERLEFKLGETEVKITKYFSVKVEWPSNE